MNNNEKMKPDDFEKTEEQGGSPDPPSSDSVSQVSSLDTLEESMELLHEVKASHSKGSIISAPSGKQYLIEAFLNISKGIATYKALDQTSGTDKVVWLKEALTPDGVRLLEQESQILLTLNLPMFLKIFEQFKDNEQFYVVEESGEGKMLAEALECGELTLFRMLSILAQLAYALAQLHEKGWIHLGIKPSSILIGKPAKLIDFGWALLNGTKPPSPFYHAGYSAPELLQDKMIDEKADIYSMGALMYYAVSGTPIPESGVQWMQMKFYIQSGGIPQVLWKCLASPENRYASMKELHEDLMKLVHLYSPTFNYSIGGASTIGLDPGRTTNQDRYYYSSGRIETMIGPYNWVLMAVADGMGGMEAGDVASTAAIDSLMEESAGIAQTHYPISADTQLKLLINWVQEANAKVYVTMESMGSTGGTTLLCCMMVENRLAIAHVGDCRLYLFRNGSIEQLTRDHSLAMTMALLGKIPVSKVRHQPERNQISRSLGGSAFLQEHLIDSLEIMKNKSTLDLISGDALILCSDGIWESITEDDMINLLSKTDLDINALVQEHIKLALERGAPDNATIIIFQIKQEIPYGANLVIGKPRALQGDKGKGIGDRGTGE